MPGDSSEDFRGIYLRKRSQRHTKKHSGNQVQWCLSGGSIYNPAQIMRDESVKSSTEAIDKIVAVLQTKTYKELAIDEMSTLISQTLPDLENRSHMALLLWQTQSCSSRSSNNDSNSYFTSIVTWPQGTPRETQGI